MRVPLSWLADLVRLADPVDVVAERLTMAGLAVEGVEECGRLDPAVRVGRLDTVDRHPTADRLSVCVVDVGGSGAASTIVSAAPGLRRGALVAVALPGAALASGTRVERRTVGGVDSAGMLCSAAELGLGPEADRVLALPRGTCVGTAVEELPGVRDTVLEIDVTPNRGDCLSVLGIAREVALTTRAPLRVRRVRVPEADAPAGDVVDIRVEDAEGCPRYLGRLVRDVRVVRSPLWLRLRLERSGMRAINAIVDAANHVMLETGQPLHTFDRARVRGRVVVRRARVGERIETLDGVERALEPGDLVIADDDGAIALAGVMGGARTEVGDDTTTLLLESAYFDPASVRRTARRLGLSSEASYRFERRVDPAMIRPAIDRLASLLARLARGRPAPGVVAAETPAMLPRPTAIHLRPDCAAAALGMALSRSEVRRRLRAIGARVEAEGGVLVTTPPSYRPDLEIGADLVEELARIGGYDKVPVKLPTVTMRSGRDTDDRMLAGRIRRLLVAEGLSEAVSLSFTSAAVDDAAPGWIGRDLAPAELQNPLSAEHARLRRSPLASLVRATRTNHDRGAEFVALFEIGTGFGVTASGERTERHGVALVLGGHWPPRGAQRQGPPVGFADLKGVVENLAVGLGVAEAAIDVDAAGAPALWHPAQSAILLLEGRPVGALGVVHPAVAHSLDIPTETLLAEVDFLTFHYYRPGRSLRPLPKFPAVTRDIAVVVDEGFRSKAVLEEIRRLNHPLIESVRLFDCYRGDPIPSGRKSLAYSLSYRAADRTLTDDEVNEAHAAVRATLTERFALDLRS